MLLTELATTNGYANVTVKGHAKQRQREWRKMGHTVNTQPPKPNLAGWQQLAARFQEFGWTVQQGGERLFQP